MTAFILWEIIGLAFMALGIYCFVSKKEVAFGFWANADTFPVKDIKRYNKAVGKLWCAFAIIFCCLGISLLSGQNSAYSLIAILGTVAASIGMMIIYVVVIENKYREKR